MRAEGTACMDAGSAPTRQADGIRRMNREATIFPPGAWDAREAAGASLARSCVMRFQRSNEHKVNVILFIGGMFTLYA
ncbi:transcriptional regulator [Citrobacter sp. TBCS-15]|nr:transcriptional regulator [Citrobacter sp. TBCS-15]TKU74983.1 transcriptional regulator [Citrobacter sp. wls710]